MLGTLMEKVRVEEKDIKEELRKKANPNCNTCYGRGYEGYIEDKNTGSLTFIPCHRGNCINMKKDSVMVSAI